MCQWGSKGMANAGKTYREILSHYFSKLLFYWIKSPFVQSKIEKMQSGSTNQVELGKQAILETQVRELTRRCRDLEIGLSQILEKDIKPLTAWKNTALGYCLGISIIGTFIMNKILNI